MEEDNNKILEENFEEENKNLNKSKIITNAITIAIAIVISVVVLVALYIVIRPALGDNYESKIFTKEQLERLEEAAKVIDSDYLYDYDKEKLIDGAINGMVESLENAYTYYEFEDEYQDSQNSGDKNNYIGIGVHLVYDAETEGIRVLGTIPNSPAEEIGIKSGDIILKVDDLYVSLKTYIQAVNAIKGEENTTVKLAILRNNEAIELEVSRKPIVDNNVSTEIIDDIGYIKIYSFENGIYNQFKEEYNKLRDQNVKGIIVDLRNNPGGLVYDTLQILNLLLPKADVLRLVDKQNRVQLYQTDDAEQIDIPLAVLVNQNSASASEIFASAIKDSGKGVVIGTKTFGKGVVQYVEEIKGHGAISIVAAQYFTPSGVVIQDNGIEPDIVVELPDELKNNQYIEKDQDLQLQEALKKVKQ